MGYFENEKELKKYVDYVARHEDKKLLLKTRIEEILKEDYKDFHDFFLKAVCSDYDFIILMSRRCLVLCQIFVYIFILEKRELKHGPKIISDKGLYKYREEMRGKRICILDDIMIHGRTLSEIFDKISEYTKGDPHISVYAMNAQTDFLSERIKKQIDCEYVCSAAKWRLLSDKLISCIYVAAAPYTSYVTAFSSYSVKDEVSRLKEKEELEFEEITTEFQRKCGLEAYCCYETVKIEKGVFSTFCFEQSVRFYIDQKSGKCMLIPYVFIKGQDRTHPDMLLHEFSELLPENLYNLRKELMQEDESEKEKAIEHKMMLLTCVLSNLYWTHFKANYVPEIEWFMDTDTVAKSFGASIAEELESMLCENMEKAFDFSCDMISAPLYEKDREVSELENVLESSFGEKTQKVTEIFSDYFQRAWMLDEQRAKGNEGRFIGLPTEAFMKKGKAKGIEDRKVFSALISSWDTGIAASRCACLNGGSMIGCFSVSGEQSYRIILEKFPYIMKSLIFVSRSIRVQTVQAKSEEELKKKKVNILLKLVGDFENKFKINLDVIKEIVSVEGGALDAWNNVTIFHEGLNKDKYKDEELVRECLKEINESRH